MEWKIADMPFLSITHYQSLEKSVSIQSLIHWFKLSLRLRIDDCHYEKINKAFAQTHTGSGSAGFVLGELFAQDRGERPDEIRDRFR